MLSTFDVISKRKECVYKNPHEPKDRGNGLMPENESDICCHLYPEFSSPLAPSFFPRRSGGAQTPDRTEMTVLWRIYAGQYF